MSKQLSGWDLATWRISQSDPSKVANIVSVVEVSGIVSRGLLTTRVRKSIEYFPILRMGVFDDEGTHLKELPDEKLLNLISLSNEPIAKVVKSLSKKSTKNGEPLWEIVLVQHQFKSFLVARIHHAIADGNSAMRIMQSLFDGEQVKDPKQLSSGSGQTGDIFEDLKATSSLLVNRLTKDPVGLAEDVTLLMKSMARLLTLSVERTAKPSSNDFTHQFFKLEKEKLRAVSSSLHVSIHDVLTAVAALSFFNYQMATNSTTSSVTINVPVAMNMSDAVANKLVVARINISNQLEATQELIQNCNSQLKKWRNEPALSLASTFIDFANFLPINLITDNLNKSDLTVSSLAGTPETLRIAGYEISAVWPVMPPVGAAINFTSLTLGKHLHLGVTIDRAAVVDLQLWQESWRSATIKLLNAEIFEQIFE